MRAKKRTGAGGETHTYYYLVHGERKGPKVRQRTLAYLGRHPNIESARAAAAEVVVPTEAAPWDDLETLRRLNDDYTKHLKCYLNQNAELKDIKRKLGDLRVERSQAAAEARAPLRERQRQIKADLNKAMSSQRRAAAIFDALSREEQERVREQNLAVINLFDHAALRLSF